MSDEMKFSKTKTGDDDSVYIFKELTGDDCPFIVSDEVYDFALEIAKAALAKARGEKQ